MAAEETPAEETAFVPGHVTGFFSVHPDDDPTRAGSRGAGLTLSDGVITTVSPAVETSVHLNGESVTVDPVTRVLSALGVHAQVDARTDLPLGTGFGVSGALALGTALAANAAFDLRLSESELVTVAHGAEVASGTGLGDVVAQARGGIPIRLEPGAPPNGVLDGIPDRTRIEYLVFDELSTPDVLAGETEVLDLAGERALGRVVGEPTLESFMVASRQFAREAELLNDRLRDVIQAVAASGGEASMAMLGETVFALDSGLSEAGYEASSCHTHPAGATMVDDEWNSSD